MIGKSYQADEEKTEQLYYYVRELNATIVALAKIGLVTDIDVSIRSCDGQIVRATVSRPILEPGPVPVAISEPA